VPPTGGAGGGDLYVREQFIRFHTMSAELDGGRREMLPWWFPPSEYSWL
jgi:hypothetical protein